MYDVIVIGGSYAGFAAALQLVRARRKVLILDAVSEGIASPAIRTDFSGRMVNRQA